MILLSWMNGISVSAQVKTPDWAEEKTISLLKGQAAPFQGFLLTRESMARSLAEIARLESTSKLELQYLDKKLQAEITLQKNINGLYLEVEQQKYKTLLEAKNIQATYYEQNIKELRNSITRKWWESPYLHFGLGFTAAGVISIVSILLLK